MTYNCLCIIITSKRYCIRRISLFASVCHQQVSQQLLYLCAFQISYSSSPKTDHSLTTATHDQKLHQTSGFFSTTFVFLYSFRFSLHLMQLRQGCPDLLNPNSSVGFFTVASCAFDCFHLTSTKNTIPLSFFHLSIQNK